MMGTESGGISRISPEGLAACDRGISRAAPLGEAALCGCDKMGACCAKVVGCSLEGAALDGRNALIASVATAQIAVSKLALGRDWVDGT